MSKIRRFQLIVSTTTNNLKLFWEKYQLWTSKSMDRIHCLPMKSTSGHVTQNEVLAIRFFTTTQKWVVWKSCKHMFSLMVPVWFSKYTLKTLGFLYLLALYNACIMLINYRHLTMFIIHLTKHDNWIKLKSSYVEYFEVWFISYFV